MDWENVASASGAKVKRPRFPSEQVRLLLFNLEDVEQDLPMNNPDGSKLGGVSYGCTSE